MKKIAYLIALAVTLIACEDVVEVELRDEDTGQYVVDAAIHTGSAPYVILTKTVSVTEQLYLDFVSNANIQITNDQGNSATLLEIDSVPGYYTVPEEVGYVGEAERTYTLTIITLDDTLTASEYLQPVEPLDSIVVHPSERGNGIFLGIFMYGNDPAGKGDYYKWDFYINDTLITDPTYLAIASDDLVDGNLINDFELLTDFHNPNEPSERLMPFGSTVQVVQKSMSEFAYNYYLEAMSQSMNGSLFSVPPANLSTNISSASDKDALGVFMAHDVSVSNVVTITDEIEDQLVKP